MLEKEVTLTFKIKGASPMELSQKAKVFQEFSKLDAHTQAKVFELMSNKKYLESLVKNWELLKTFV